MLEFSFSDIFTPFLVSLALSLEVPLSPSRDLGTWISTTE